jgi:hypothetical protein
MLTNLDRFISWVLERIQVEGWGDYDQVPFKNYSFGCWLTKEVGLAQFGTIEL